ncbi:putative reverse transcriptase domain-containing protein [Tanacetum coccineum]
MYAKDNKKSKTGSGFVATVPPRNDNMSTYPKYARCYTFHPKNASCKLCYNCQKPDHYVRQFWAPIRQVTPVNAVRIGQNQRACYECGSLNHFRNDCPKWKQATGQAWNPLVTDIHKKTKTRPKLDKTKHGIGKSVEYRSQIRVHLGGPT